MEMNTLTLNKWGNEHPMTFEIRKYADNGNLYIGLITHEEGYPEPWSNLTVNLGVKCKENCGFIDVNNNGIEIIDWLIDNKLGRILPREKISGFCVYPEFEFDIKMIEQYS